MKNSEIKRIVCLILLAAALMLVGCSSQEESEDDKVQTRPVAAETQSTDEEEDTGLVDTTSTVSDTENKADTQSLTEGGDFESGDSVTDSEAVVDAQSTAEGGDSEAADTVTDTGVISDTQGETDEADTSALTTEVLFPEHRDELYLTIKESDLNSLNAGALSHSKKKYPVHLVLYSDGEECFSVDAGIKTFGNTSVEYDKKSYRIKFSSKFGPKKLKYKLFDNLDIKKFDSFVLRSGSQDNEDVMLKDEFIPQLLAAGGVGTEVLTAAYRPVSLYINDEYRGLYYIREHMDESMIASHYGCEDEEVTLIEQHKEVKCGPDGQEWLDFWKYVDTHDLSDEECMEHVKETVSLESVADYYITQLWLHNIDPDNVRVFKAGDGLWRYALYDLDLTLCDDGSGSVSSLIGKYNKGLYTFNSLIYKLLGNEEFREYFTQRAELLYDTVFSYDNVVEKLDAFTAAIDEDMRRSCELWGKRKDSSGKVHYFTYDTWQKHLEKLKVRLEGRTDRIKQQLSDVKGLEFKGK